MHHRLYFHTQDIDVSSRGGCAISVLSCLCVYRNRPKNTTTVTTPNGSDSSTRWDCNRSSKGAPHIWFTYQLPFRLPEKHSSRFKMDWSIQFYSRVSHCQLWIQCPERRRCVMLLNAEPKKWVCALLWVECGVRTVHTQSGAFLLGQRRLWNDKVQPPTSSPFPKLVAREVGYRHNHYTSHDAGEMEPQELLI